MAANINQLLAWLDNKRKVVANNMIDMGRNPVDSLNRTLHNAVETNLPSRLEMADARSVMPGMGDAANEKLLGLATMAGPGATVFHGSPRKFDKFDLSKIGSGDGGSSYGHGFSMAGEEGTAKLYAKGPTGSVYKIDLPDEHIGKMLNWDLPLNKQPKTVLDALKAADVINPKTGKMYPAADLGGTGGGNMTGSGGADIYNMLARQWENSYGPDALLDIEAASGREAATKYLQSLGIPGIKYFDPAIQRTGRESHNFVVFSPENLKILESK